MENPTSIADVVMHPVRLRIIQQLGGRELTTSELRAALPDVTQATIYRHVAALVDAAILDVVDERRVRGAVERTLALGERMAHVGKEELHAMSDVRLRAAFLTFLADLGSHFDRFIASDEQELRDYVGFGQAALYVNTDDLAVIQAKLGELLEPYLLDRGDDRRRTAFATVLVPEAAAPQP